MQASDDVQLAYSAYLPDCPVAALVFYHGGGAHGQAGYTYMAEQLAKNYNIATYLFDIRGHGRSGGQRGHTSTPEQVWADVGTALEHIQQTHPGIVVFLGGHSAGAGMLLNYAAWTDHKEPAGYMLVTPFLGKDVDIFRKREKKGASSFAKIHAPAIITHRVTCGFIGGDWVGLTMNYPEHYITERGFVGTHTVNMLHALNAQAPLATLQKIQVPTTVFIADKDELFDPEKMDEVFAPIVSSNKLVHIMHLACAKHLTVLGEVDDLIGKVIRD